MRYDQHHTVGSPRRLTRQNFEIRSWSVGRRDRGHVGHQGVRHGRRQGSNLPRVFKMPLQPPRLSTSRQTDGPAGELCRSLSTAGAAHANGTRTARGSECAPATRVNQCRAPPTNLPDPARWGAYIKCTEGKAHDAVARQPDGGWRCSNCFRSGTSD